MSERCQRCGSVGTDRRTLWMACFYEMGELGLPFTQYRLTGWIAERTGTDTLPGFGFKVATYAEPNRAEPEHHWPLYTLRVCKRCRGEWMRAISEWFRARPENEDEDSDEPTSGEDGVFARDLGAIVRRPQ